MTIRQRLEPRLEGLSSFRQHAVVGVLRVSHRHVAADLVENFLQCLLVKFVGSDRQTRCDHAAAQVHAHGRWDDGLVRGDHRTDGGANAQMDIGHRRHVVVDEWQTGDVGQLHL